MKWACQFYLSPDLGLIEKFSDTITVMQQGFVVEQGETKAVFSIHNMNIQKTH